MSGLKHWCQSLTPDSEAQKDSVTSFPNVNLYIKLFYQHVFKKNTTVEFVNFNNHSVFYGNQQAN